MNLIIKKIFNKDISKIILVILILELFSLISYSIPLLSAIYFFLALAIIGLFTLYKLEYGLYIALIELMIGSQGYLYYLEIGDFRLSFRIGLFLLIFFIWLFKYFDLKKYIKKMKADRLLQNFIIFIFFIGLGIINGIIHNNGLKNIFFDFNGYLYFGLFFVFLDTFISQRQIINYFKVLLASLIYVSGKIFLTLYLFTHGFESIYNVFYTWIRDTRVGEITWAGGNFFRIFLQSQIYSLIAIFIITSLIVSLLYLNKEKYTALLKNKYFVQLYIVLIIVQTSILISFSRSFWLAGITGFLALFTYLIFIYRSSFQKITQIIIISASAMALSIGLMLAIVNFPLPLPSGSFSASMIQDRLKTVSGEAGASSRWNLLPVLLNQNKQNLLLGTGFGSSVTYQTEDPRIKNDANPEGWYTTYTFEWGYLDTITEIGIIGLLIYLALILQIFWRGFGILSRVKVSTKFISAGFLIGLIVLLVTHAFSPYLNHPLGIGYLMLCAGIFSAIKRD